MRSAANDAGPRQIAPEVYYLQVRRANVYFVRSQSSWALIDTGWAGSGEAIRAATNGLFGMETPPAAILLTHAHQDHYGSAAELAELWDCPVYVHPGDLPYLRGGIPPDEVLDPIGRVFKVVERVLPRSAAERLTSTNLKDVVSALPDMGGRIPWLAGWEFIRTPGHSPGHVVFYRRSDRVLIAGDAVLTAPCWGVMSWLQRPARPPWIASWDWKLAKVSVARIAALEPLVLATGHGTPMVGPSVPRDLQVFAGHFTRKVGGRPAV
jgi:glyoxylase-like metal-dependent hydrolase (beta-lactamase superfamily II)